MENVTSDDWRKQANCNEWTSELFYMEKGEGAQEAKMLCGRCAVQAVCLEYAIEQNEQYGVWGGLTPAERDRFKRKQLRRSRV